jgi:glutathione S-transferase
MITLYSYPDLYGVPDNNPYGFKIYAFLKLCTLPFEHKHILDTTRAPRGQLPYLEDNGEVVGDSDTIITYLTHRYGLDLDSRMTNAQRNTDLMVRRTLDDLYWVMSYSRWHDDRYWPLFRRAVLNSHPEVTADQLQAARRYNFQRYHYQGIGRFEADEVYKRGIADLSVLDSLLAESNFLFGPQPISADAGLFGFIANIYYYEIDTPLRCFVQTSKNLASHCDAMRVRVIE